VQRKEDNISFEQKKVDSRTAIKFMGESRAQKMTFEQELLKPPDTMMAYPPPRFEAP
jgi:hypothetical protein